MTEQLQLRRGTATQVVAFTGARGEVVVDTTNNRLVVQDGATAGGFAAAKLSDVAPTRTAVSDAAYTVLATDELVAYVTLTAARAVTLCAASAYPVGARLMIVDETGACSSTTTITVSRAGSDTIDGGSSFVINAAYAGLEIESNGSTGWIILSPRPNLAATLVGIGTPPNPGNPLSVYGAAALFNGPANMNLTINKGGSAGAASGTASLIFEDGFSGRAQVGLTGSDNFSFKVSPNGSAWTTAIAIDATTGAATFANQRTAVSDAAYSALTTDRLVVYTAITAARVVTLPAASSCAPGQRLTVVDESGACSATNTITLGRAGSDTINGAASAIIAVGYGYIELESNGSNAWTIIDTAAPFVGDSGSGGAQGLAPAPPAHAAAYNEVLGAGGSWVGQMAGFRNRIVNGGQAIDQRNCGASQALIAGAALAYTIDPFYAYCTGANVAGQRVAGSAPDQYLYQFTGAASVTAIGFAQRIEAANSFDLAGTTATFSVKLANSLLTTVTWTAYYATTTDTFGSLASPTKTQIATGSFTVNSTLARYGVQIAIPSAATTGVEIALSVGAQTGGTWTIGAVQLEPGQVVTPFERRPIGLEVALCQRYLPAFNDNGSGGTTLGPVFASGSTNILVMLPFQVQARVTPTGIASTAASSFSTIIPLGFVPTALAYNSTTSTSLGVINLTVSGATPGQASQLRTQSVGAQILFTGCEL